MFPSLVEQIEPAPKHPLKKLLDRIRSQRNQWIEHETAPDLPTVITDEIPEKDTTTDTGSLTRENKSNALPFELHKTTHLGKKKKSVYVTYKSGIILFQP